MSRAKAKVAADVEAGAAAAADDGVVAPRRSSRIASKSTVTTVTKTVAPPKRSATTKRKAVDANEESDVNDRKDAVEEKPKEEEKAPTKKISKKASVAKTKKTDDGDDDDDSKAKEEEEKEAPKKVAKKAAPKKKTGPSAASAILFASLPIYVAAELFTYLDLSSIFALFETSRGVRKTFRTSASAAILATQVCKHLCPNHAINPAGVDANEAWSRLRGRMELVWTGQNFEDDDCAALEACVVSKPTSEQFSLRELHDSFCCLAHSGLSSTQRRNLLQKKLKSAGTSLRSDSSLCNGWINGSNTTVSLFEVVAIMSGTAWLFGHSHIVYSNNHEELNALMRQEKFSSNLPWLEALAEAKSSIDLSYGSHSGYDSEGYGYSDDIECWNCGEYGHMARECWY